MREEGTESYILLSSNINPDVGPNRGKIWYMYVQSAQVEFLDGEILR